MLAATGLLCGGLFFGLLAAALHAGRPGAGTALVTAFAVAVLFYLAFAGRLAQAKARAFGHLLERQKARYPELSKQVGRYWGWIDRILTGGHMLSPVEPKTEQRKGGKGRP